MSLSSLDVIIIVIYAISLFAIATFVSREKAGHQKNTEDYFLAGRALPWWAIGASLIAANISAEQIIGQSGQGFVVGLAIAAYEWQAAIVLLIVAKFFLPIFLRQQIYTMPQFLDQRYGGGVKTLMSVYWIVLYTAINLTTVLWLGGLAVESMTGIDIFYAMIGLAGFAVLYSLYGGLKAVALTDFIQVIVLIAGGVAITIIALDLVGGSKGVVAGMSMLADQAPDHFKMILSSEHPSYGDLPGVWTLLGGLWVLHFSYWGFNQYIIQRALGAENLREAQKGLAFAAFLKLFIPFIVVIPGIAAVVLTMNGNPPVIAPETLSTELGGKPDRTYGALMQLAPNGFKGLIFAALMAAIVSSLASMMNSISTIFTMDVYRSVFSDRSEKHYVGIGRVVSLSAMIIAVVLAQPLLQGLESGFQTLQEYTGFIAPGVVAIFLLGMFWKRINTPGAYAVLVGSIAFNVLLKIIMPDMPFVVRIWLVFVSCILSGALVSYISAPPHKDRVVELGDLAFKTSTVFNVAAILVTVIFIGIYVFWW